MSSGVLSVELSLDDDNFTTKVTAAGDALVVFNTQINNTSVGMSSLETNVGSTNEGFLTLALGLHEATRAFENIKDATIEYGERILEVNSSIQKTTILLQGLSTEADSVSKAVDAQKGVQNLLDIASTSPFKLETITDSFVKMKTAGLDPANGSMKALMDAVSAFGGDDGRLQRAAYAFQEMAGRGVISLQNLRRQLGQDIPGSVELMARALNLTVAQLDQKVQSGTLNSAHALTLLADEFDRTYGGATGRLLQTFDGRISQITSTLQRLALVAGGTVRPSLTGLFGDSSPSEQTTKGSFYAESINQIKQLNDILKSPEMVASAITLNNTLRNMAETAGSVAKAIIEWRDPIFEAIEWIGGLGAAIAAIQGVALGIRVVNSTFALLQEGAEGSIGALRNIPALLATVSNGFATVTGTARIFGSLVIGSIVPDVALAGEGIGALAITMAGLTAAFAVFVIPVGMITGFLWLEDHLAKIRGQADLTTPAIQRLLQGDITSGNTKKAENELTALKQHIDAVKASIDTIDHAKIGDDLGHSLGGAGAVGDISSVKGMNFGNSNKAEIKKYYDDMKNNLEESEKEYEEAASKISDAPTERIAAKAQQDSQNLIQSIESSFGEAETVYRNKEDELKKSLEALTNKPGNNEKAIGGIFDARKANAQNEENTELDKIKAAINVEQQLYDQASEQKNQSDIRGYEINLHNLEDFLKKRKEQLDASVARQGTEDDGDAEQAKDVSKARAASLTLLDNYKQRLAGLNANLDETGSFADRLAVILSFKGWGGIDIKVKEQLLKLVAELDDVSAATKRLQAAARAEHSLDMGLDHANEQLLMYSQRLNNPGMTEGSRLLAQLQEQITRDTTALTARFTAAIPGTIEYANAFIALSQGTEKAKEAMDAMTHATALATAQTIIQEAHNNYLNSLSPKAKALAELGEKTESFAKATKLLNDEMAKTSDPKSLADLKEQLKQLNGAKVEYEQGASNRIGAADAKAAKPAEDAIASLKESIAKLKGELAGTTGTVGEWTEKLNHMTGMTAALRAQILGMVNDQAKLTEEVNKYHQAQEAIKSLEKEGENKTQELDALKQEVGASGKLFSDRGKTLEIEKNILAYKIQQNQEVQKSSNSPEAVSLAEDNEQKNLINQTIQDVQKLVVQTDLLSKSQHSQKDEIADLNSQTQRYIDLINKASDANKKDHLTTDQQTQALNAVKNNREAQIKEIQIKNQDAITKMISDWGNFDKEISKVGQNVVTNFADQLTNLVTTGKANWKSFGEDVIKQLDAMIVKLILAIAYQKALSVFGGIGGGGAGGAISGLVGDLFHTGGIVGSEPTSSRFVDMSVFSNAAKYHTGGLAGNEVPAILQKGEGVFTAGQMSAMGGGNTQLAAAIQALTQVIANPPANTIRNSAQSPLGTPSSSLGSNSGGGGNGSNAPKMTINMNNQSGQNLTATSSGPQFNGESMVLDIVIRNVNQPGALRTAIKNV